MSDILWTNTTIKLGQLKPWQRNPRQSTKKQAQRLLASWDKFGQVQTIAIDPEGNVLDGHQRLSALLTVYGKAYQVDARQSNRALTEKEREELVATLHAGAVGSWDWEALSSWDAPDLMEWGFSQDTLADWKRDVGALGNLLASEEPAESADAEPQVAETEAEKLAQEYGVQEGQVWRLGRHLIACVNCLDVDKVREIVGEHQIKMVFADPPYGVRVVNNGKVGAVFSGSLAKKGFYADISGDDDIDVATKSFDIYFGIFSKSVHVWWGANYYANHIPNSSGWIVWDKRVDSGIENTFADCELAWSNMSTASRIYRQLWNGMIRDGEHEKRIHPTQKPVALAEWVFSRYGEADDIILDPFLGSGISVLAAENLENRTVIGFELSPAYIGATIKRWEVLTGNKAFLVSD